MDPSHIILFLKLNPPDLLFIDTGWFRYCNQIIPDSDQIYTRFTPFWDQKQFLLLQVPVQADRDDTCSLSSLSSITGFSSVSNIEQRSEASSQADSGIQSQVYRAGFRDSVYQIYIVHTLRNQGYRYKGSFMDSVQINKEAVTGIKGSVLRIQSIGI